MHFKIHIVLEIGFRDAIYSTFEGTDSFYFEIEVKNNVIPLLLITFTVCDSESNCYGQFSWLLFLHCVKQFHSSTLEYTLQPNKTNMSILYDLSFPEDNIIEENKMVILNLTTSRSRVSVPPECDQAVVTIIEATCE